MVCVTNVNHCKPRYFGAAEKTKISFFFKAKTAVVKTDKGYSCQVRVLMAHNYYLINQNENFLGVKVDTNPFSMKSETW